MHELLRINSRDREPGGTPDSCSFKLSRPIEGKWRLHTAVVPNSAAPVGGTGSVEPLLVLTIGGTRYELPVRNLTVAPHRREYHSIATLIADLNTRLNVLTSVTLGIGAITVTHDVESNHLRLNKPAGVTVTWHSIDDEPTSNLSPVLGLVTSIAMASGDATRDTDMPVSLATDMLVYTIHNDLRVQEHDARHERPHGELNHPALWKLGHDHHLSSERPRPSAAARVPAPREDAERRPLRRPRREPLAARVRPGLDAASGQGLLECGDRDFLQHRQAASSAATRAVNS